MILGQIEVDKVLRIAHCFFVDPIYVLRKRNTGATSSEAGRYIGVTAELPETRLKQHLDEAYYKKRQNHRLNWLRSLEEDPVVEVIEWVLPMHREEREKYWIALFRDYGHRLVNGTDGGKGASGHSSGRPMRKPLAPSKAELWREINRLLSARNGGIHPPAKLDWAHNSMFKVAQILHDVPLKN